MCTDFKGELRRLKFQIVNSRSKVKFKFNNKLTGTRFLLEHAYHRNTILLDLLYMFY